MAPVCFSTPFSVHPQFKSQLLGYNRLSISSSKTIYIPIKSTHYKTTWRAQLPPASHEEPPLTDEQKGPPGYKWNPDYPGTLKPGSVEDNYPLWRVLESDVYEKMQYEERDLDERDPIIFEPDEDLLHWLAEQGRLLPRGMSEEEFEMQAETQISGMTEEELDYADDDSKMIAYYSKQGEGTAAGASSDFGGFADSSAEPSSGF